MRHAGHEVSFSLPSLVYPSGRAFIDVDLQDVAVYIKSLGISEKFIDRIIPKERGVPTASSSRINEQLLANLAALERDPDASAAS